MKKEGIIPSIFPSESDTEAQVLEIKWGNIEKRENDLLKYAVHSPIRS